jgi:hypothetical protein
MVVLFERATKLEVAEADAKCGSAGASGLPTFRRRRSLARSWDHTASRWSKPGCWSVSGTTG